MVPTSSKVRQHARNWIYDKASYKFGDTMDVMPKAPLIPSWKCKTDKVFAYQVHTPAVH
jgi:hypothetical protein